MIYDKSFNDGKHVFVFGSNIYGIHGRGAARDAKLFWGAETGVGNGRAGMSYAIPTKLQWWHKNGLSLITIAMRVILFAQYAERNPDLIFLVTRIGCGNAGYTDADIAPMFEHAPKNCLLPDGWRKEVAA